MSGEDRKFSGIKSFAGALSLASLYALVVGGVVGSAVGFNCDETCENNQQKSQNTEILDTHKHVSSVDVDLSL